MSQPESATCNRQEISRNPQPDAGLSAHQRQPSSYCRFSGAPPYHLPFAAESRSAGGGTPARHQTTPPPAASGRAGGQAGGETGREAPSRRRRWLPRRAGWGAGGSAPRRQGRRVGGRVEGEEAERFAWGSEVILGGPASVARLTTPRTCPINPRGSW